MKEAPRSSAAPAALALCLALAAGFAARGAEPLSAAIAAQVTPGVYHLGNLIPLEIEVPLGSPAFYLEGDLVAGADWGDARIASVKAVPPASFPGTLKVSVQIQVFATGPIRLPPLPLTVRTDRQKQAYAVGVKDFAVTPILPPGNQPEPPAAAPLPLPKAFPWGWLLLGLSVVIVAALVALRAVRRRARPAPLKKAPELKRVDPDRWIREEIERLFKAELEPHVRYAAVSQRLRDYLELKTGFPFLEWTTSEVQIGLRRLSHLPPECVSDLMGVLSLCDWTCFARYRPEDREETDARERALRFAAAVALAPSPVREGAA